MAAVLQRCRHGLRSAVDIRLGRAAVQTSRAMSEAPLAQGGSEPQSSESRSVIASLVNPPNNILKEELLYMLRESKLTPEKAFTVLDDRLRPRFWRLEFDGMEDYDRALEVFPKNATIGTRTVRFGLAKPEEKTLAEDQVNRTMKKFRDKSLLLIGAPPELRIESVERFFHGFQLAPMGIWHFWVETALPETVVLRRAAMNRLDYRFEGPLSVSMKERRTVVKFATRAEALRALREKQGAFLQDSAIELRLVQ